MLHHIENHINRVRQKPEHKRRQYAFAVSFCFTLIVFGFWITARRTPDQAYAAKPLPPLQALTASVNDAYDYLKSFFVTGNKTQYESQNIEVLPGKI